MFGKSFAVQTLADVIVDKLNSTISAMIKQAINDCDCILESYGVSLYRMSGDKSKLLCIMI